MKRPPPALVAAWYARLRAAGFVDIEGGRDLNQLNASTFMHADGEHRGSVVGSYEDFGERHFATLADHPTAVYYRELEHAARALHGERRKLMLVASEGNSAAAARALGRKRNGTGKLVRRFAAEIGLRRETGNA